MIFFILIFLITVLSLHFHLNLLSFGNHLLNISIIIHNISFHPIIFIQMNGKTLKIIFKEYIIYPQFYITGKPWWRNLLILFLTVFVSYIIFLGYHLLYLLKSFVLPCFYNFSSLHWPQINRLLRCRTVCQNISFIFQNVVISDPR